MSFKDFLNLHPTLVLTLFLTSQASADAEQEFSSKTSDASVTNDLLDQEYSDLQPEYSKPQPEFSKLEPQYSDTAYSNSGPTAAFLPLDDKEVVAEHPDALTLFAVLLLALLIAPATVPGQTWSPFTNLAWRLSSAITGRSFSHNFNMLSHDQERFRDSVDDMLVRGPAHILEDPSTSRFANVDPRSIFHNWQKNL